jgi:hypothetical protein
MTDEIEPDRQPDETEDERENKGSADEPWRPDEQQYADRPEQSGGAGLRTEPSD